MPPPPQQPQYPNQPQQPQYPYGQQPPQPPPPPGPYGSPNPQQPYPPQPYPPQPYGQQPYPAWGMPPMGPPPKKSRVGLVVGIVGGVVGLVVLGVVGLALIGLKVEHDFPAAENKLTLPRTLLDQKYELTENLSDTEGQKIEDEVDGAWDAKVTDTVVGRYGVGGSASRGTLVVSGLYGRFQNTAQGRTNMLKGAGKADGVTVVEPARDVTPSGADTTIACEVVTEKQPGVRATYPVCAWADGNTAAIVGEIGPSALTADAADVDLDAAARHTAQVRSEMVKPIG
ncbi:hypothetical protein [Streptomyces sp. NPDC007905]|uniref:hypothetical protein n=1 Tax=Streptomyces sp. NPDC007905 TaxID=3364788 RepID=UPI0036F0276C